MTPLPTASVRRRLASLCYELLLTGAVTCVAAIPAGIAAMLLNPVAPALASAAVSLILLGAWWLYYRYNWTRRRQTLPMQVWRIGLRGADGAFPPLKHLLVRFLWCCLLIVFVPLLAYAVLHRAVGVPPKTAAAAALFWWILPWGFAFVNRDRQFLYDYLADTRLVKLPDNET